MAGRKAIVVTDRQYQVLELLWEHGPLTVREMLEFMPKKTPYTTVLGLMQTMEKAGLVSTTREENAYRYAPTMTRQQGTKRLLTDIAKRFFGGSARRLALGLVESGELSAAEIRELEAKLKELQSKRKP
ncbi:MAG: BlaI/MecI/CopY family transcriptional regulator [Pirellulales bacterium]